MSTFNVRYYIPIYSNITSFGLYGQRCNKISTTTKHLNYDMTSKYDLQLQQLQNN